MSLANMLAKSLASLDQKTRALNCFAFTVPRQDTVQWYTHRLIT